MTIKPDVYGRYRIPTNRRWQGGPASITLEIDAVNDVAGEVGLLIEIESSSSRGRASEEAELSTNVGTMMFTARGPVKLSHSLMVELDGARKLRDAFAQLVVDMENVLEHGWTERDPGK
jgi:hypothetical protein